MTRDKPAPRELHYHAGPPGGKWIAVVSVAIGGFALLWAVVGIVVWTIGDTSRSAAVLLKLLIGAGVPSAMVGAILATSAIVGERKLGWLGLALNGLTLLAAIAGVAWLYLLR